MALDAAYALIFGGCCSNVFALEAIVKHEPDSGLLITVTQFILVALFVLPSQLERSPPPEPTNRTRGKPTTKQHVRTLRLQPLALPLRRLTTMSFMFFAVNMLNNWAFAFDISVPLHIILRSFGSVTTLIIGYLYGKRYSRVQVLSVLALTVGVVVSAWADAEAKGKNTSLTLTKDQDTPASNFVPGLIILFVAQVLSAYMGVYTEVMYGRYGRHWRQTLFYSHVFGLAFSAAMTPVIWRQLLRLWTSRGASASASSLLPDVLAAQLRPVLQNPALAPLARIAPPQGITLLLVNALTQVACISGVNRLSAQTTAVTVTVVLNIRKLVSFLLSCVIFGNELSGMMAVGAAIVFAAGAVYGWDSSRKKVQGKGRKGE